MSQKIVLKKKTLSPIHLENQDDEDCVVIDAQKKPLANGPFSAKIRGGLSISVAKSGYQKSIRRQYLHLANIFALLWFEVGLLYPPLMSNLINRLIVIAGEDCAANLKFLHWIDEKISFLRQKKKTGHLTEMDLCIVTTVMVQTPKTRISSWLKSVFYDGLNHPLICSQVESLYPGILDLKTNFDQLDLFEGYKNALLSIYPLLSIRYAIKAHIENRSYLNLIWSHLLKIKDDEHMKLFYRWYTKEKNENRIYLVLAHVYFIDPGSFQVNEIDESHLKIYLNEWKDAICNGKVKIPYWMIDMHTLEGKKKGMNVIDFATMGSRIENIWPPLFNKKWLDIYISLKKATTLINVREKENNLVTKREFSQNNLMPKLEFSQNKKKIFIKKKENLTVLHTDKEFIFISDEILSIIKGPKVPRGQLITAAYKPYVYLPREAPQWVFKGPFTIKRLSNVMKLERRYRTFKKLGSQVIDVELMKDSSQSFWIRYKNLATVHPDQWQTETKHDKINNMDVEIIKRESLGFSKLSQLPKAEIEKILFDGDHPFYLTFLDATLLGCGDLGEHNSLVVNWGTSHSVVPWSCYLIDYDDSTTRKTFQTYYDVYARHCSSQKILFDHRVPTISHLINARIALYKQKQSELEKSLGSNLNQIISEMEKVYMNKSSNQMKGN